MVIVDHSLDASAIEIMWRMKRKPCQKISRNFIEICPGAKIHCSRKASTEKQIIGFIKCVLNLKQLITKVIIFLVFLRPSSHNEEHLLPPS